MLVFNFKFNIKRIILKTLKNGKQSFYILIKANYNRKFLQNNEKIKTWLKSRVLFEIKSPGRKIFLIENNKVE